MATERIITARPNAIPITAMVTIGCDIPFFTDLSEKIRRAIKSSVFKMFALFKITQM